MNSAPSRKRLTRSASSICSSNFSKLSFAVSLTLPLRSTGIKDGVMAWAIYFYTALREKATVKGCRADVPNRWGFFLTSQGDARTLSVRSKR